MTVSISYPFDEFASRLLADALVAAKTIKDARIETEILSRIAIYYSRFQQQNQALEVLTQALNAAKKIKEPGSKVKTVCGVAAICQFEPVLKEQVSEILTQALQVAQIIQKPEEQNQALSEIAFRYKNAGQEEQAMQVFEQIADTSDRNAAKNSFWHRVIREYTDTGQHDQVIQTILAPETINSYEKLSTLFWMAVDYEDFQQIELAKQALSPALEIAATLDDSPEKVSELLSIASVYSRIGARDKAVEILTQALTLFRRFEPEDPENTSYILTQIVIAFAQAGQPEYASQLAQTIQYAQNTLYLEFDVLKEIGSAYAKAGQSNLATAVLSQAIEVANAMQNADEKADSLSLIAAKYVDFNQINRAAKVLDQAINVAKTLKSDKQANTLNSIVFFYRKAGLYDKALEVAKQIKDKNLRNKALADLAYNYIDAGEYNQVLQIVETLGDPRYKAEVLARLALKLAETGEPDQSFETFTQAMQVAKNIKNPKERTNELGLIVRWYMKTRQYDYMFNIIKNIEDAFIELQVLTWLANGYKQAGNQGKAAEIVTQANQTIERIKDSSEKAQLMAGISFRYAVAGEYDQALKLVRNIKNAGAKALALLDIVDLYAATILVMGNG